MLFTKSGCWVAGLCLFISRDLLCISQGQQVFLSYFSFSALSEIYLYQRMRIESTTKEINVSYVNSNRFKLCGRLLEKSRILLWLWHELLGKVDGFVFSMFRCTFCYRLIGAKVMRSSLPTNPSSLYIFQWQRWVGSSSSCTAWEASQILPS